MPEGLGEGTAPDPSRQGEMTVLVLSGGIALGAFEAGVYAGLAEAGRAEPDWLLGSSAGALNAAIIAGNPPGRRVEALRQFWKGVSGDPTPWTSFLLGPPPSAGAWRRAYGKAAVMQSLLLGRPGLFQPRIMGGDLAGRAPSLYDLAPLRRRLPDCLDFERLNHASAPRLSVVATDVVSGERVVFDTRRDRIGPEHLLASCALLPVFAPVEVEGRLLGDGGLSSNAPLDLLLGEVGEEPVFCLLVELFAQRGSRPRTLAASASRAGDLAFGNQTRRLVEACEREFRLRALIAEVAERLPPALREGREIGPLLREAGGPRRLTLLVLGQRAGLDEAGLGKVFDFSPLAVEERWLAGAAALREGLRRIGEEAGQIAAPGLVLHEVEG
ncbi:patatin-like phospholipase family protein [Roseomonas sp. KE2513]|uniref:patatin-like phospholipase family protein n=1 Tax=Roseomonas sp. KE2513 TaxID=2479202 RepID=UPI0018DFE9EA|nr:patatin-like phospholipase family protein [Roseomonas sp. KE2513]MBI0535912.1 patatin-like phospholipase family protein [Roseomonas sp. KE2513]